jgi:hypothetical protein
MLTLISNNNLGFTKPKCNCGINASKNISISKNKSNKNKSNKNRLKNYKIRKTKRKN